MLSRAFWQGKKVFLTGHTGFKGSWLSLWLHSLGAQLTGYALPPPTQPSLFVITRLADMVDSVIGDVRDFSHLQAAMAQAEPEIVLHMAAQPLVRESYRSPLDTYAVNVMGTAHLLEACRHCDSVRAVINVTTDKCYENREWVWGYRENDPLGGYDPYSSSKGCSELLTAAYRSSYGLNVATVRAGNVIGGGDWAADRLVPDFVRSLAAGQPICIRSPLAIRPWQHVLEPLAGYLLLAEKLHAVGAAYAGAWNFGPDDADARSVEWIVTRLCKMWGNNAAHVIDKGVHLHEAAYLKLDCSKAKMQLGWRPRWQLEHSLLRIVEWVKAFEAGQDMHAVCLRQIADYLEVAND